jgi:hypothetical protein
MIGEWEANIAYFGLHHRGLAVTSRDDVIDGRPPLLEVFFCDFTAVCHNSKTKSLISKKI